MIDVADSARRLWMLWPSQLVGQESVEVLRRWNHGTNELAWTLDSA